MPSNRQPTPHELLELHELIRSEVICAKKINASLPIVKDQDLQYFMQNSLNAKRNALGNMDQLYSRLQSNTQQGGVLWGY